MSRPSISVIIPCYNQQKHIEECLKSVFLQDFEDYELIAVDDGSTDSTSDILKSFSEKDGRLRIFKTERRGAGAARNTGISKAEGEYLLFMDSDDFLAPGALGLLNALTEKSKADIYFFNFNTFDDKSGISRERRLFCGLPSEIEYNGKRYGFSEVRFEDKKEFFLWSYVAPWNKLYRRKFVIENKLVFDELYSTNDRTFYFSSLLRSTLLTTLDATLINYRINNDSSLTGRYDGSKFENRRRAYFSSLGWIDRNDKTVFENFMKVTVLDFVSFFEKSLPDDRFDIFLMTSRFFREMETEGLDFIKDPDDRVGFYYRIFAESGYLEHVSRDAVVPIVFATNGKYLPYLSVALRSVMENSEKRRFYDVFIFHTGMERLGELKICSMSCENFHVRALDVSTLVKNLPLYSKGHFSVEMYYRILIPELLSHYGKVLYLDCDLVLNSDAGGLLDQDIGENTLAAVRNPLDADMYNYVTHSLGLDAREYFNSGVLIINTERFRKTGVKQKCFDILAARERLACPDQDILNLSCHGNVAYLGAEWNFQVGNKMYSDEERYRALPSIRVIHFTTGEKPWNAEGVPLAEEFFRYARSSPFYEEITARYAFFTAEKKRETKSIGVGERIVINGYNMRHYALVNPDACYKKPFALRLFSLTLRFFDVWRGYGLRVAVKKTVLKIRKKLGGEG